MHSNFRATLLCAAAFFSLGANYRTPNFEITAPTPELAREMGRLAERLRSELATLWLGKELPTGAPICDLELKLDAGTGTGATTITYDRGRVVAVRMTVAGPIERLRAHLLPHEMTHLVLAFQFGRPVPRWLDEGGAVMAEHASEWQRQDTILQKANELLSLRRLFAATDYPRDVMTFYAQASSLSRFLLARGDRQTLVEFTRVGQSQGWDEALNRFYQLRNVEALERAWLEQVRRDRAALTAAAR